MVQMKSSLGRVQLLLVLSSQVDTRISAIMESTRMAAMVSLMNLNA